MIYFDERNEYVDIEPYLIPETRKLLIDIETKTPNKVNLRKVYDDSIKTWHIRTEPSYHIDMPSKDEGNIVRFTHELLHLYFDYVLGMKINHLGLPQTTEPYKPYFENKWHLANHFIYLINDLQHYKMIPYFSKLEFPLNRIIDNYESPTELLERFESNLMLNFDLNQPANRYSAALSFVNFLALELYFPNPLIREKLRNTYSQEFDKKFVGLREVFLSLLEKWDTEYNDLPQLIKDINFRAKDYAEGN
jgi:hypothetical protein